MKTVQYLLWMLLFAAPWRSFAQNSFCYFDSLWKEKAVEDTLLPYKHNAYVSRVNQFRQNTQLNHEVIPYAVPPQGLGSGPGCRNAIFVIPVVVHIVYDPNIPQSNLPDSLVEKQIEILNQAYANEINPSGPIGISTGIQFCLAQKDPFGGTISGIDHISDANPVNVIFNDSQKNHLAGLAYYDQQRYLNIWVVPDIDGAAGYSTLAYMSGVQGVILEYNYFGDYTDCSTCGFDGASRGLILAHEIGHYLGLFHPFQGECVGTTAATCTFQGDFCCDTRPTKENHNCPVPGTNQCPGLAYYGSQSDNYENFMMYADDACRDNFTPDQVSVMHSVLSNDRKGLVSADNINSLALSCCLAACWFNISNGFLCEPGDITFKAIEHTSVSYRWQIYNDTVQVLDTALSTAGFSWTLSRYGRYNVKLSVITGTDSVVLERTNLIELRDCGPVMASTQGNWFFGKYAGLQFRTGGPIPSIQAAAFPNPTVNSGDGGISYSNTNGGLLFYAGGDSAGQNILRLYKQDTSSVNHIQVFPSTPLYGHQSSSQTGIVIPFKHDSTRFHLFVVDAAYEVQGGCYHTILDIDTPNLAITGSINLPIPVPAGSVSNIHGSLLTLELITSVPACDGNHWLIVADGGPSDSANYKQLLVYLVTDSTITYISKSDAQVQKYYGQLKASPDGSKIAASGVVFNFDRSSGTLTLLKKLPDDDQFIEYLGTSFSPNSRFLYFSTVEGGRNYIYQYNLESTDSLLSRQAVPTDETFYTTALQLGPDGKIYVTKPTFDELAVISNPDSLITRLKLNACGFDEFGPSLKDADGNGGTCYGGLPNMMDAKYPDEIALNFSMIDSACGNMKFFPNDACASTYFWDFGDGDTTSIKYPVHSYADTGSYVVTLTVNGSTQKSRDIRIGIDRPQIAGDTLVSCNLSDITTYSIANLTPEFKYTWEIEGGEIVGIEEIENARVRWDTIGYLYVEALDLLNGCKSTDSLAIRIGDIKNNAFLFSGGCFSNDSFLLDGTSPVVNFIDTTLHYQWQYTTSIGNSWLNTSVADTLEDLTGLVPDTSVWFRRYAYNSKCESISDSIKTRARTVITGDLKDLGSCSPGSIWSYFPIQLELLDSTQIVSMDFERYQQVSVGVWDWVREDSAQYPDTFYMEVSAGDSIRIKLSQSGCDPGYTRSAFVRLFDLQTDSNNNPSCDNVSIANDLGTLDDGIDTFLVAQLNSSYNWLYQTANCDSFFEWDYSRTANSGYSVIPDSHNDTLFLTTSVCNTGYYRVRFKGRWQQTGQGCYPVTSCNYAELKIDPDLWSMDGFQDTGKEKNDDANRDFWNSPDLWNCWQNLSCTTHESPEYMQAGTNRIYTTIRNKGQYASDSFKVYLYWTLGGFYEKWPISWHFDTTTNGFYNPNYGQTFPMDSEIDSFELAGLAGGDSTTVYADWNPPYPPHYDTSSYYNSEKVSHLLCILSRIVTCDDSPYGMTFPEIEATGENVINNNNIITRNTEVQDSLAWNKKSPVYVLRMGNQYNDPKKIRIVLDNLISNYWALGYFTIRFDGNIFDAWRNGGQSGANYSLSVDEFKITGDGFYLDNIVLDSNEWGWMYVQFHLHTGISITTDQGSQLFRFIQSSCDTLSENYQADGGFNFLLNLKAPTEEGGMMKHKLQNENKEYSSNETVWIQKSKTDVSEQLIINPESESRQSEVITVVKIYPNPTSGMFQVRLNLQVERSIAIELYSTDGQLILNIPEHRYSAGSHQIEMNGSILAPGSYLVRVFVNGEPKVCPVVIAR